MSWLWNVGGLNPWPPGLHWATLPTELHPSGHFRERAREGDEEIKRERDWLRLRENYIFLGNHTYQMVYLSADNQRELIVKQRITNALTHFAHPIHPCLLPLPPPSDDFCNGAFCHASDVMLFFSRGGGIYSEKDALCTRIMMKITSVHK